MIKLENVVLTSPEQMEFIIEGMRNPMDSLEKSDSYAGHEYMGAGNEYFKLGKNDHSLMQRLAKDGTDHRKFMRMMPVYVRITAPLYWWKEFDTYTVPTVANSCSTMCKIVDEEFTLDDFSCEFLLEDEPIPGRDYSAFGMMCATIYNLNRFRDLYLQTKDKKYWWQMIQLLPSSYNKCRTVTLNYEVLADIYRQMKNHKLDEWQEFCKWIESLPYSEIITGGDVLNYEALANVYRQMKKYKLDEQQKFCEWVETLPYSKLITGGDHDDE